MNDKPPPRWQGLPAVLAATAMAGWVFWHGSELLRADALSLAAQQDTQEWAAAGTGWTVPQWKSARGALQAAAEISPDDPVLQGALAQLYITQGNVAWADLPQRDAFFEEALVHQQASLKLRPQDGPTWAQVAVTLYALRRPSAEIQTAWNQAARYAPREAQVQLALADLAFATWAQTSPNTRAWVLNTWAQAAPATRQAMTEDARRHGRLDVLPAAPPRGRG